MNHDELLALLKEKNEQMFPHGNYGMVQALHRVIELHKPKLGYCQECTNGSLCLTINAIEEELS